MDDWYSTAIDIKKNLSKTRPGDFHVFVADVVKSFDTVGCDILDCVLGRLGLLRFAPQSLLCLPPRCPPPDQVSSWPWCSADQRWRQPQRCPSRVVCTVAHYVPRCRDLESLKSITYQLYAENLECTSYDTETLLRAAQFSVSYVKVVGQEAASSKCVQEGLQTHDCLERCWHWKLLGC